MSLLDTPLGSVPLGADAEGSWVSVQDTLQYSDALAGDLTAAWVDTLQFSDELTGTVSVTLSTVDTLQFSDVLSAYLTVETVDTLQFSDELLSEMTVGWVDTLQFSDELAGTLALSAETVDTLQFSDELGWMEIAIVTDTLQFSDELLGTVAGIAPELADTLQFSDELLGAGALMAPVVEDTLWFSDELLGVLALAAEWTDTLWFIDELADAHEQILVVTNLETGAVSRYVVTPELHSLAEFSGTLYLAGPDGLYAMDAAADDDGPVAWTVSTGFSALGTDLLKRIQDVNVLARTQGDTTLTVISAREGDRIPWPYTLPPLARAAYRDGVIKVGKGVQSVYYQLDWAGAGPAEIDQLRLTVEPLSRRR